MNFKITALMIQNHLKKPTAFSMLLLISSLFLSAPVASIEIDLNNLPSENAQSDFEKITKDLHAIEAYQDSQPADSKSILIAGFEVGVNATQINLQSKKQMKDIGVDVSTLVVPRLVAVLDVFSFGVAATYLPLYDGAALSGVKLKYVILNDGLVTPALDIHATYSTLSGVDSLDSHVTSMNVGVSKEFLFITAYGHVGYSQAEFSPDVEELTLEKVNNESFESNLGVRFSLLGVLNLGVQLHSVSDHQSLTLNLGLGT